MKEHIIDIAADFSRYPGGRYRRDGDFSGEQFREDVLVPILKNSDSILRLRFDGAIYSKW